MLFTMSCWKQAIRPLLVVEVDPYQSWPSDSKHERGELVSSKQREDILFLLETHTSAEHIL